MFFGIIDYVSYLICITFVTTDRVKEMMKFWFYLNMLWLFPYYGHWCSRRCWYIWLLNVTMVFEFLIYIGIEFHSFAPDTETAFCSKAVLRKFIWTLEPFPVILCDTLFLRSKLIFFTLYLLQHTDFYTWMLPHFAEKMLLKLIHFKSFNSWVTWSRFKYFPLLATFAAKLIHFCTSYCSFSLHLPHIKLQ